MQHAMKTMELPIDWPRASWAWRLHASPDDQGSGAIRRALGARREL